LQSNEHFSKGKAAMLTAEIRSDEECSLRVSFTREQREAVRQAAELENRDFNDFVASAAIKSAGSVLTTHESRNHILRIGGK
jgi:uncharacterized protein (DUF1778 family)